MDIFLKGSSACAAPAWRQGDCFRFAGYLEGCSWRQDGAQGTACRGAASGGFILLHSALKHSTQTLQLCFAKVILLSGARAWNVYVSVRESAIPHMQVKYDSLLLM